MKQITKKINTFLVIWILVIIFAKFINSNSISDMFGLYNFSNYGFNYESLTYFIGYNILWLLPLIFVIINFILVSKLKLKIHNKIFIALVLILIQTVTLCFDYNNCLNSQEYLDNNIICSFSGFENGIFYFIGRNIFYIIAFILIVISLHNIKQNKQLNNDINSEYPVSNESKKLNFKKIKNKKGIKNLKISSYVLPITIVFLICSISFNVMFLIKHFQTNNELLELEQENENINTDLNDILNNESKSYIKNKINFFDNKIVFVIEGYGNYYSNYDCMLQRTGNSEYSYWAYNIDAAKSKGYKEYKCSNLTYKNGYLEIE